jgi:hypothetical protein
MHLLSSSCGQFLGCCGRLRRSHCIHMDLSSLLRHTREARSTLQLSLLQLRLVASSSSLISSKSMSDLLHPNVGACVRARSVSWAGRVGAAHSLDRVTDRPGAD